jgi:hypothetical protein
VAAAWGDARWWVVDGVLHATGLAPAAAAASPARFVAPIPEGPPPARPVPDGPAREAWPQPPMPEGAAAVLREVAIVRDEAGLRGMAADGERWRRPGSEVSTQLGELVIDGVVVEAATGRDMGPVPDGAQRLGLRDGALLSAHVEGDDAVVRQDGVEIARLPRGSGEELGAVAADAELVYLGVGRRLVALDAAGVRWQVTLATRARADRPMVTELRVAGDLLLARTLSPLIHLKPVWAFDRRAGDVVDLLDLGRS